MPKRGFLGCSIPVLIGALVVLILFAVGLYIGPLGQRLFVDVWWLRWLEIPRPEFHLPAERVFNLFSFPITNTIIAAWVTMFFLVRFSYAATRRMKLVPGRLQGAFEFLLGWLYDFCCSAAGERDGRRFFPIVATIFLFVAFNAWLGLLPGFGSVHIHAADGAMVQVLRPAGTDINMPLAIALMSFVFVQYFGFKTLGYRYVAKFVNVGTFFRGLGQIMKGKIGVGLSGLLTGVIEIFVGLLELLSEFIHIISFTFRLFGNMTAGEILIMVAIFLVPWVFVLPFYGLELLVGFLQALIFGGLTLIFLTLAVARHGEAEES